MKPYVAIMAGGIGSRFWPCSREARPKQFLDIFGVGKSLLRLTFDRFTNLCPPENIFIVTNARYKDLVKEHLPEITDNQILCEPSRNDTAPCIAYTAFKLHALDPNANFVVAPSDHVILNETEFLRVIRQGLDFVAKNDALMTLGIEPTNPNTGYGYINYNKNGDNGIHKVIRFMEKPNLETAKQFLASGDYVWNGGIFLWNVKSILKAFETYQPEIYNIFNNISDCFNTEKEQEMINEHYPNSPKISVDYAIMENAKNIYTIPADFNWSDLGTWNALYDKMEKDENKNVVYSKSVMAHDVENCLIYSPDEKLVVVKDLKDYVIVDEKDALLIYPRAKEQEIKAITKAVAAKGKQWT